MNKPLHTLSFDCKVGIWETAYVARIYTDKIIIESPGIKWVNNSGSLTTSKNAIRDKSIIDQVLADIADDCESSAWEKIGAYLDDYYLYDVA
jgi:hypothetical protein